jgi:hypothetical protein
MNHLRPIASARFLLGHQQAAMAPQALTAVVRWCQGGCPEPYTVR